MHGKGKNYMEVFEMRLNVLCTKKLKVKDKRFHSAGQLLSKYYAQYVC